MQESAIIKKSTKQFNRYKFNQLLYNYFVIRDFKEAINLIDKLQDQYGGTHEYANLILAYIQKMTGNLSKSIETFKLFLAFNDSDQEALKTIAKNLQLAGRYKACLDVAQKALVLKQNDWEIFYTIGNCYYAQKDYEKAQINYKQAYELSVNEVTYTRLGKFYLQQDRVEDALLVYKKALNSQPQNNELKTLIGVLLLRNQKINEAKKYFEDVQGQEQQSLLAMGSLLQDTENYDEALNYYRKLLAVHPTSAHVWNNIAMCYYGKDEVLPAVVSLKRALYFDPFEWTINFNLGLVHLKQEQYLSAFHYFQTAITLNPDDSQSYMYLGIALDKLDDYQNACRSFERAIDLDIDKDYLIYLNYCIILLKSDETIQKATSVYSKFLQYYQEQQDLEDNRISKQIIASKQAQITIKIKN